MDGFEVCLRLKDDGARIGAEKIGKLIVETRHDCDGASVTVTATFGVNIFERNLPLEECIRRADTALYKGKDQGRNQVV